MRTSDKIPNFGKGMLCFHGASNDKGQDPDNKKLEPPSPEHPFFVSPFPSTAIGYAEYPTGDDGRILDNWSANLKRKINPRVYVVSLSENLIKTENYFTITDEEKVEEAFGLYMSEIGLKKIKVLCKKMTSIYALFDAMSEYASDKYEDELKYLANNVDDAHIPEETRKTEMYINSLKYPNANGTFSPWPLVLGELTTIFRDCYKTGKLHRRDLKGVFFRKVHDDLGYNVIGESDTNGSSDGIAEFGIMDKSLIVDGCLVPLRVDLAKEAYNLYSGIEFMSDLDGDTPAEKFISAYDRILEQYKGN